jgi:hypothetical protein
MPSDRDLRDFSIGQSVVLHIGRNDLAAQVIEDRGYLGADGGRVFRVSVSFAEGSDPSEFEVPASALDAPAPAAA